MGLWEGRVRRANTRQPLAAAERRCVPAAALPPLLCSRMWVCHGLSVPGPLLGFSLLFLGSPVPGCGDSSPMCQQSLGSPTNPCPACGRSLETLESSQRKDHLGGVLCLRAPCKPGMGKGVSHSSSFPQGAGGQRAARAVRIPWCPVNSMPVLQAEASVVLERHPRSAGVRLVGSRSYGPGGSQEAPGARGEEEGACSRCSHRSSRKVLGWGGPAPRSSLDGSKPQCQHL